MNDLKEPEQPVGFPVEGWHPRLRTPRTAMAGRYCVVEPLQSARHAADLYQAYMNESAWGALTA